jgi:putative endonuclease
VFYYTYVLKSIKDGELYIGYTSNLKKRIQRHNKGLNTATKPHIPYGLIHFESFLNKIDAKNREIYLKSGWGLRSIKKMLAKYFQKGKSL